MKMCNISVDLKIKTIQYRNIKAKVKMQINQIQMLNPNVKKKEKKKRKLTFIGQILKCLSQLSMIQF